MHSNVFVDRSTAIDHTNSESSFVLVQVGDRGSHASLFFYDVDQLDAHIAAAREARAFLAAATQQKAVA